MNTSDKLELTLSNYIKDMWLEWKLEKELIWKLTELDVDSRRGLSHEPISVFVHCSPSARQSRPINGILRRYLSLSTRIQSSNSWLLTWSTKQDNRMWSDDEDDKSLILKRRSKKRTCSSLSFSFLAFSIYVRDMYVRMYVSLHKSSKREKNEERVGIVFFILMHYSWFSSMWSTLDVHIKQAKRTHKEINDNNITVREEFRSCY